MTQAAILNGFGEAELTSELGDQRNGRASLHAS